jgi:hypothetical protein
MIAFLILLGTLVVLGVAGTVRELLLDRPVSIPRSRFVDPDLLPPASRRPVI